MIDSGDVIHKIAKINLKYYLISALVAIIPEIFFSWYFAEIINVSSVQLFLAIQVIKLVFFLIRRAVETCLYFLNYQKEVDKIYNLLIANGYPNPEECYSNFRDKRSDRMFLNDPSTYFLDVSHDEDIDANIRVDAAQIECLLNSSRFGEGPLRPFRLNKVFMKAIKEYQASQYPDTYCQAPTGD